MGFVSEGLEAGMGVREKWGRCGIWFVNMLAIVDGARRVWLVEGHVPLFRRVARISCSCKVSIR
jgi:hypothetical protein